MIALFRVKTVNLAELATSFGGSAELGSHYKPLQRFFREFQFDYYDFAQSIVALMNIPEPWILSFDRTPWQFGKTVFNILTLGIIHEGVAIPVLWWLLDKNGNSHTQERIELFQEWQHLFPERSIRCLTAEREFLGQAWFEYLLQEAPLPLYCETVW
ncbi:MAG: hypothetical protein AAGG02_11370 [Cyanobacteria bacterium P01_H01_bin.15]